MADQPLGGPARETPSFPFINPPLNSLDNPAASVFRSSSARARPAHSILLQTSISGVPVWIAGQTHLITAQRGEAAEPYFPHVEGAIFG
jgi:hypothetical protein